MEVVVDYVSLKGHHNEVVIKELAIVGAGVIQTYHFKSPYFMANHGSTENGMNWEDGHIPYTQLPTVLSEAVAGYTHLYAYGDFKCKFLASLINRTFLNLEDLRCPNPQDLRPPEFSCGFPCHKFPCMACPTSCAYTMFKWLLYHFQTMSYVKCPPDFTRHTASFIEALSPPPSS
jgi:hypothetical protein